MDSNAACRTYDGIEFDSAMEMKYYRDVCVPMLESGEAVDVKLQEAFELQPGFIHDGKKVRPITYVADFVVTYADGRQEVIDIKGMADTTAKIKRKLFWYRYPDITYRWLSLVQRYGGWIDYDELQKKRKEFNKAKKEKLNG